MDRENIRKIKELLDEMLGEDGENKPSDEDLDFDDDYIEMYTYMHHLRETMKNLGW